MNELGDKGKAIYDLEDIINSVDEENKEILQKKVIISDELTNKD